MPATPSPHSIWPAREGRGRNRVVLSGGSPHSLFACAGVRRATWAGSDDDRMHQRPALRGHGSCFEMWRAPTVGLGKQVTSVLYKGELSRPIPNTVPARGAEAVAAKTKIRNLYPLGSRVSASRASLLSRLSRTRSRVARGPRRSRVRLAEVRGAEGTESEQSVSEPHAPPGPARRASQRSSRRTRAAFGELSKKPYP